MAEFGGGLVGNFSQEDVRKKFDRAMKRIDSIMLLAKNHPCECIRLLVTCANHGWDFFVSIMPTQAIWDHCVLFDQKIMLALTSLLAPVPYYAPVPDHARALRVYLKSQLPRKHGGLGLIPLCVKPPTLPTL